LTFPAAVCDGVTPARLPLTSKKLCITDTGDQCTGLWDPPFSAISRNCDDLFWLCGTKFGHIQDVSLRSCVPSPSHIAGLKR
jgi:hypothetical protein